MGVGGGWGGVMRAHVRVCAHVRACTGFDVRALVGLLMHARMHARTHACACMHESCMCVCVHVCMCGCVRVRIVCVCCACLYAGGGEVRPARPGDSLWNLRVPGLGPGFGVWGHGFLGL